MKLVSGHRYLRGTNGEVVPYSESLAAASKYEEFVQEGDFENELQFAENQKIVARKSVPPKKPQQDVQVKQEVQKPEVKKPQPVKAQPVQQAAPKKVFEHMDIRQEMASDLEGLE